MNPNESQQRIIDTTEGMIVVDAGPGTGKTKTIVSRYSHILELKDENGNPIDPRDVLLLTFTNNAAMEMSERLKAMLIDSGDIRSTMAKKIQARTFDSFCMNIVTESPEYVSRFFGIEDKLSHNVSISTNSTINLEYFYRFFDEFLRNNGEKYGDYAIIATEDRASVYSTIDNLMSRGIMPLRKGWFGLDADSILLGDLDSVKRGLESLLDSSVLENSNLHEYYRIEGSNKLSKKMMDEILSEDRSGLIEFIHDVFHAYISQSIRDNHLTFGLVATFAFVILYGNHDLRKKIKYRYVMIDEFQDTNANQLMIALMILDRPNLCVVGDWKQGIYGFRYVSIENITRFEEKVVSLRRFLNDDYTRVTFSVPEVESIPLTVNYRSSEEIIDTAFKCLEIRGKKDEEPDLENITRIFPESDKYEGFSHVRFVEASDKDDEAVQVARAIIEYLGSGKYSVLDGETLRSPRPGDIGVIARSNRLCMKIQDVCSSIGISCFLDGDVNIMATREGKLALAWLRFISNEQDPWGYIPILADMKYTLREIQAMGKGKDIRLPPDILAHRSALRDKRRRINELLTGIFEIYGLDNDITQAIINTISSVHRGSLTTISDIITMMEEDIENDTTYNVERSLDTDSVSIMTMHKSKGLEFPIVIIPYIDNAVMPPKSKSGPTFSFDRILGLRCKKEIARYDGYSKICPSWKYVVLRKVVPGNYDEERRLMFVATSRAKQYETIISSNPSLFFEDLREKIGGSATIPDCTYDPSESTIEPIDMPDVSGYEPKRTKFGIHEVMDMSLEDGTGGMSEECDEVCGKGIEYGKKVHRIAYQILKSELSGDPDRFKIEDVPEVGYIRDIIRSLDGAKLIGEVDCGLPLPDLDVTLRGVIDLIAIYPDRIEIHDYKTDVTDRFQSEYVFQLSVYAHAAMSFYGLPARCHIDYISQGKCYDFDPSPMTVIESKVEKKLLSK